MQTTLTPTPKNRRQAFLSDRQVAERYSVSRQTPWGWLKKGVDFPQPISLSRGCTRWRLADLEDADHNLTSVLLEYGWLARGGPWYASPFSQSKGASVQVFDQRAVSFTSSDEGRVGKVTPNGWVTYDAWDVFVACEHDGNERAALNDYCERSGYNQLCLKSLIKKWEGA